MQTHRRKKIQEATPLGRSKKRWFFAVTVAFPFLFLLILETGLRVFHYGPNLSLLNTETLAGRTYHIMNPDVKNRYFSRFQFTPNSSPDFFLVPKPKGTFRIFCLGGSTTVGFPYWYVGSFSTFLRDRLHRLFPDRNIEVINFGLTATNSYTTLDMARELVEYEPDLFVVYDGHNEFYGALGVASNESVGHVRWITFTYLKLLHLRTFLFVRNLISKTIDLFKGGAAPEPTGTMMERLAKGQHIPFRTKTYDDALDIFKANLHDLAVLCGDRSIPLLLSTQVSNLRDHPPFVSGHDQSMSEAARGEFRALFERGGRHSEAGRRDSALVDFRRCVMLDSLHAGARYELARCLDTLGRKKEAREQYTKARDYDQLRFRTSTDFNNAILHMSGRKTVVPIDMERAFLARSPDSLIGRELILEHLHPNAHGYFLMAKEFASAMRNTGIIAPRDEWDGRDTLDDNRLWADRAMTEFDELCAKRRTEYLTAGWPFRPRALPLTPVDEADPIAPIVEQVVRGKLVWEQGHVAAAEFYEAKGDYARAEREYKAIINQIPLNVSPYLRLGQVYLRWRKHPEARMVFTTSASVEKTSYAYKVLGSLAMDTGAVTEAVSHLENAFALSQTASERSETGYMLALAYTRAGMSGKAIELLQKILATDPGSARARNLLQQLRGIEPGQK